MTTRAKPSLCAAVRIVAAHVLAIVAIHGNATQHIACPAHVTSGQITVQASNGWTGFYLPGSTLPLQDARAWWGRLEDRGVMIGETDLRKDGSIVRQFDLASGSRPDWPKLDKWMVCDYGRDIYQAIKLPDATKLCTVTFRRDGKHPATNQPRHAIADIACE